VITFSSQRTSQVALLPEKIGSMHGNTERQSLRARHVFGGSQVSVGPMIESPQMPQSLSSAAVRPTGQQPSSLLALEIGVTAHRRMQSLPVSTLGAQGSSLSQFVGHAPGCPLSMALSQSSPKLTLPSPQLPEPASKFGS
jgi:hypothetical protein